MDKMLRGHIDSFTTLNYVEGWAFDASEPSRVLAVSLRANKMEVAYGFAHRFRADLMQAGYGVGWCAFRLRLALSASEFRGIPVTLAERETGGEICSLSNIRIRQDEERPPDTVESLKQSDPTLTYEVSQLERCDQLFLEFIAKHGVDGFLSAAYAYMLGRPLDPNGRTLYARSIKDGTLTPWEVLKLIERCDEYRSRPRFLAAPTADHFPFLPAL